jgi:hypothetical protein
LWRPRRWRRPIKSVLGDGTAGSRKISPRRSVSYRKTSKCVCCHIFLAEVRLHWQRLQLPEYGASHEHHNDDDLPDHAQLVLGSTQAAHHGMATAGAFTARARGLERRNVARHRHDAMRCAPRNEQTILDGLKRKRRGHNQARGEGRPARGGPSLFDTIPLIPHKGESRWKHSN